MLLYGKSPLRDSPPSAVERRELPVGPDRGERARHDIEAVLAAWGRPALTPRACQCVSELLAAVPDEGVRDIALELRRYGDTVEVDLVLIGARRPFSSGVTGVQASGAQLTMVDRLSSLWGVVPLGAGERVWFEVD